MLGLLSGDNWAMSHAEIQPAPLQAANIKELMDELSHLWTRRKDQESIRTHGQIDPPTVEACDNLLAGLYFLQTVYQLFAAERDTVTQLAIYWNEDDTWRLSDNGVLRD